MHELLAILLLVGKQAEHCVHPFDNPYRFDIANQRIDFLLLSLKFHFYLLFVLHHQK